jgi:hypothetical protein
MVAPRTPFNFRKQKPDEGYASSMRQEHAKPVVLVADSQAPRDDTSSDDDFMSQVPETPLLQLSNHAAGAMKSDPVIVGLVQQLQERYRSTVAWMNESVR